MTVPAIRTSNHRSFKFSVQLDSSVAYETKTLDGISYLVFPVISMVGDSVVWPANSSVPCFVPSETLSFCVESRNYRPIVMNHPHDGKDYVSACSPDILSKYQFGFIFNARFEDGKVKSEMWLDPLRAEKIGIGAPEALERLKAGEIVEVSEGDYTIEEEVSGVTSSGEAYGSKWLLAIPDHLAILPLGVEGACSVSKHGCGGNRVMSGDPGKGIYQDPSRPYEVTLSQGLRTMNENNSSEKKPSLIQKFLSFLSVRSPKDLMMKSELQSRLYSALAEVEPGLYWVEDHDESLKIVIYSTRVIYNEWSGTSEYSYWQRSFSVDGSDNVTIGAERQQVQAFVVWKPVVDDSPDLSVSEGSSNNPNLSANETPCGCKDKSKENEAMPVVSEKKKNLIQSLISGKSPFTAAATKVLEEMEESVLEELDSKYKEEEKKPEAVATSEVTPPASTAADSSASTSTVEVPAQELEDLRSMAAQYRAQQEAQKSHLIKSLLANPSVSSVYKEEDLKKKSLTDLSDLAKICKVETVSSADADFSVIPFTTTSSVNKSKDETAPGPTVSLSERLKQKRAATKS